MQERREMNAPENETDGSSQSEFHGAALGARRSRRFAQGNEQQQRLQQAESQEDSGQDTGFASDMQSSSGGMQSQDPR
jgi:hypothetical protein